MSTFLYCIWEVLYFFISILFFMDFEIGFFFPHIECLYMDNGCWWHFIHKIWSEMKCLFIMKLLKKTIWSKSWCMASVYYCHSCGLYFVSRLVCFCEIVIWRPGQVILMKHCWKCYMLQLIHTHSQTHRLLKYTDKLYWNMHTMCK